MRPRDPLLQAQLEEIGAIRILNFLSPNSFNEIRVLHKELDLEDLGEIYFNIKDQSLGLKCSTDQLSKENLALL